MFNKAKEPKRLFCENTSTEEHSLFRKSVFTIFQEQKHFKSAENTFFGGTKCPPKPPPLCATG